MKSPRAHCLAVVAACVFALCLLAGQASGQAPADIKGFAPVSVSSANYREMPSAALREKVGTKSSLNPAPREVAPLAVPRFFVFVAGENFPADLSYETVCSFLTPELAKKNFINAADANGIIREPAKVTLVLRVNYGVSLWRTPVVRTERLAWDEGLVGKMHDPRSLTHFGGIVTWDARAGGNDDATSASAANDANTRSFWGSGGGGTPAPGTAGINTSEVLGGYDRTRDYNLIVVDAFDYVELKSKGKSAKALWTTFVAAPVQRGQSYAQALPAMLRSAAPYWGETTAGMQVFTDARARVDIGEVTELKDPSNPKK